MRTYLTGSEGVVSEGCAHCVNLRAELVKANESRWYMREQRDALRAIVDAALAAPLCCDRGEYGARCTKCRTFHDAVVVYRKGIAMSEQITTRVDVERSIGQWHARREQAERALRLSKCTCWDHTCARCEYLDAYGVRNV